MSACVCVHAHGTAEHQEQLQLHLLTFRNLSCVSVWCVLMDSHAGSLSIRLVGLFFLGTKLW